MDFALLFLKGVLPPAGAALLLVSLLGGRWLPLAAGLGLLGAFALVKEWPALPTELWRAPNGPQWLCWAVVGACLLAWLEHLRALPARLAPWLLLPGAVFAVWLVVQKVGARWAGGEVLLQVDLAAAVVAAAALAWRNSLQRGAAGLWPAVTATAVLSLDAALLAAANSALLGQLCGAVAAAVGAAAATQLWRPGFVLGAADATWLGVAHGLFLVGGHHLADLPLGPALLAASAPLLPLILAPGEAAKRPALRHAVTLLVTTLPGALALWWLLGAG